jgi:hypothetical protein
MPALFSKKQLFLKLSLSLLLLFLLVVYYSAWQNWNTLFSFGGAYLLGVLFLFFDEQFLYRFYEEKIDVSSQKNSHFPQLISRNFLFLLSLPLLSIFVATSSGSVFGIALIVALNFYLLVEMWQLRSEFLLFKDRFMDGIRVQATATLVKQICWGAFLYFVFLLLILIF